MRFDAAPLGRWTRIVTVGASLLAAVVVPLVTLTLPEAAGTLSRLSGLLGVPLVVVAWAMAPKAFELAAGDLRVIRNAWRPWTLPGVSLRPLTDPERIGFRILGNGGLFGFYGRYRRGDLGGYRLFATTITRDGLVAVQGGDGDVAVVSPADVAAFTAALAAKGAR